MFITQDLDPCEMLAELFKGQRVSTEETKSFAGLMHDRDLCPEITNHVNTLIDVYRTYGNEVHNIQGLRDDGVDIILRYEDREGYERRAGIQIKSEDEFRRWEAGNLSLPQILKAQHGSAIANARLNEYYLLLFVDADRHRSRIQIICSELKNFRPLIIVEPQDLLNFYSMKPINLWARATRILCDNDSVLKSALNDVRAESPDVAFFMVDLVCRALGESYEVSIDYLDRLWSTWLRFADATDCGDGRREAIIWKLTKDGVLDDAREPYILRVCQLPKGLCALYFDLCVRVPHSTEEMRDRVISLLDLAGTSRERQGA